jgi:hypothetical protein
LTSRFTLDSMLEHSSSVWCRMLNLAVRRNRAYVRALSRPRAPKPELPPLLKAPMLPADFALQGEAIDRAISERGVAVNRDRILSLGSEQFLELLEKDHDVRKDQRIIGTRTDLTSFAQVQYAFQVMRAFEVVGVQPRSTRSRLSARLVTAKKYARSQASLICGKLRHVSCDL